jgi:hypothetical protein
MADCTCDNVLIDGGRLHFQSPLGSVRTSCCIDTPSPPGFIPNVEPVYLPPRVRARLLGCPLPPVCERSSANLSNVSMCHRGSQTDTDTPARSHGPRTARFAREPVVADSACWSPPCWSPPVGGTLAPHRSAGVLTTPPLEADP